MRMETENHGLELRVRGKGLSRKESRKGRSCRRKGRMGKERWEEGRRGGSEMESSRTSLSHFSLPLSSSIYSPSASSCH